MKKTTQGPSFTHQDVEDCYLAASQYEESAKRYLGERHGKETADAHDKIAARFRKLAGRIQAWLPTA